ncbi:uncharacterized protein PgNI_02351 [Pyricularia grisea]|uniref:Uncharacterized protein n=1 Tax=Pyricularia grisea TaxID=148305 RepID=A0A6P8BJ12_PYRGI|nr:uncharacterized protein PgNI_02351 [Pyricularia grisea]TLD16639.1 hypothetical protein PgNI_02351 [Pyricularia grisea]
MSYVRVNNRGSRQRGNLDDSPPPPYSETDIFSTSGPRSPFTSEFPDSVVGSVQDAQSTTGCSTSTESGEVIYTPPLTPTSPSAHQSTTGSDSMSFSSSLLSAAAYFESRPPTVLPPGPGSQVLHTVTFAPETTPEDIPYPPSLAGRDVSAEDWHTFVNFLLPDHTTRVNEAVADRKLRAEGGGGSHSGSSSSSTSTAHAEAQLEQIFTPGTSVCDGGVRKDETERTVREWNEGFFAPRGVAIVPQFSADDYLSPWESASASRSSRGRAAQEAREIARENNRRQDTPDTDTPVSTPTPHRRADQEQPRAEHTDTHGLGLRFGGLNLGGLHLDSSGIRFDGRPLLPGLSALNARGRGARQGRGRGRGGRGNGFPGAFFQLPPPPTLSLPRWHHHTVGSSSGESTATPLSTPMWSPGAAGVPPVMLPRGFYEPAPPHKDLEDEEHYKGGGGHRGRRQRGHDDRPAAASQGSGSRSRSSSVASARSASSASSVDSIESLPAYEDLADEQIPVARDLLRRWLDSPGQAITRESARVMNEEIRSAGGSSVPVVCMRSGGPEEEMQQAQQTRQDRQPRQQQGRRPCGTSSCRGGALPSGEELAELRREVQEMSTQWKEAKHAQRRSWREERRERRRDRRAEWRERREAKREVRSAKRALKREARDLRWGRRREGGPFGGGGVGGGPGGLFGFGRLVVPIMQAPHLQHVPPNSFMHCCRH